LAKGSDDNFTLNTNSTAYKTAEKMMGYDVYDATKTELSEDEWAAAKLNWQE
jgi:hypothetical protein